MLHFDADQLPPVQGFWSLTMYDEQGFFVDNPDNRYAVRGERPTKNPDGSVDIYIQRENPGADKEPNWLPTPAAGDFTMLLRLYWPDQGIIDGSWNPPAVTRSRRTEPTVRQRNSAAGRRCGGQARPSPAPSMTGYCHERVRLWH